MGEGDDQEDAEAIDLNKIPKRIVLSHADFVCKLRMPYARCYYTVQGKTYRDTHVVLLDTSHKHFDMRKLIVGMSRVTHGKYVHVATVRDEKQMLSMDSLSLPAHANTEAVSSLQDRMGDTSDGLADAIDEEDEWDPSLY